MRRLLWCAGAPLAWSSLGCGAPAVSPPTPAALGHAPTAVAPAPRSPLPQPKLVLQQLPTTFDVLDVDPRGELLAVAEEDEVVVLRHSDRSVVARLTGVDDRVSAVSFTKDGGALVARSVRGRLHAWNVEADSALATPVAYPSEEPLQPTDTAATHCADGPPGKCRALSWKRFVDGQESEWTLHASDFASAQRIGNSDAVLLRCPGRGFALLDPDGAITSVVLPAGMDEGWAQTMSPKGEKLALRTMKGLVLWNRARQGVIPVPFPRARAARPPPTLVWHHDGEHFITFESPHGMPDPDIKKVGYLFDGTGVPPIQLEPDHAWTDSTWHPTEPIVFLNSGWGAMTMLSWWAGSEVSVYRTTDGSSLGKLRGHTVRFSPKGSTLLLFRGHPSRGALGASTDLVDPKTQRTLLSVPGFVRDWALDESWFVTTQEPRSSTNAAEGPPTYTLHMFPGGQKKGSVVTDGSVKVDAQTAELTAIDETWKDGATEYQLSRWNLLTGASTGRESLAADDPRVTTRWQDSPLVESKGALSRITNLHSGVSLSIYTKPDAAKPDAPCQWLLMGSDGAFDGDAGAFFKMREHRNLRAAPLTDPEPLLKGKRRPGLYRTVVAPRP